MKTLAELRKALKAIGFGVRTVSNSFGRSATYYHIVSGRRLTYNVFTSEDLAFWKVLFDFRKERIIELKQIRVTEDCTGLV